MRIHANSAISLCTASRRLIGFGHSATACSALLFAGLLSACGGSMAPGGVQTPSAATTPVQVNLGDSPADWMLAFSMNITSMTLTGNAGPVNVVSTPVPMEMMRTMGAMQPLSMIAVPQGTYTGATITIGSATVMYVDPVSKALTQQTLSGPMLSTIAFSAPITAGTTPMAMNFDLDLAASVSGQAGALNMNPVFHMSSALQGSGNPASYSDGGVQQMMGVVSSTTGSSFAMTSMQAAQALTFMTSASTIFSGTGMSSMGSMSAGMLLMVDATLQSDGSLMATHVESMMGSGGAMGEGMLTSVTGQPATQLALVMQNGVGAGMMASAFSAGITVNLSPSTSYSIDAESVDLTQVPFTPVFDASHIYAGQAVMPVSASGMMSGGMGGSMMGGSPMAGSLTASAVELEPQGLSGTNSAAISSGTTTSFTLTLPADSAFTALTGASTVTIYPQSGTNLASSAPIAAGSTVHVFGLVFFDGGQWKMVPASISMAD